MKLILLVLSIFTLSITSVPASANNNAADVIVETVTERVFNAVEKHLIKDYYGAAYRERFDSNRGKRKNKEKDGLPPGLAKRDTLPPGLEKQLDKNGALPPGLAKRSLPDDLLARLPQRKGSKRVIVDNDVVLIEEGTNIVLDVLEDILTGN